MPEAHRSPPKDNSGNWVALSFDFGLRRIGLAIGDSVTRTARPLGALQRGADTPWAEIQKRIREQQPTVLVAGIPYNADGSAGTLTAPALQFAEDLERRFGLPVAAVDERWSSQEASERLREARRAGTHKRRLRREDIDAGAACVILERWLET